MLICSEEYSVQAKPNAANVAYTSGYLQLHTDLPYYNYKPGVSRINSLHQFFRMLVLERNGQCII